MLYIRVSLVSLTDPGKWSYGYPVLTRTCTIAFDVIQQITMHSWFGQKKSVVQLYNIAET